MRKAILQLTRDRGPSKTICPSDAARAVGGDEWRAVMDTARDAARALARDGEVEITQKAEVLDTDGQWRGPVRIRVSPKPTQPPSDSEDDSPRGR